MKKKILLLFLILTSSILALVNGLFFFFSYQISLKEPVYIQPEYPKLPQLYLSLNGTTLEEINTNSKIIRYSGNDLTLFSEGKYTDFSNVEIKGRGNWTWNNGDKKPYQIKFNSKVNLLGLGKAKSFVLLANHMDITQIRNDLAFYIASLLGLDYTNSGKFVEVYVDDEYIGLYYLTQKVALSSASVKIKNEYAVLMELDNIYNSESEKTYLTEDGDVFVLKDSISDDEDVIEMATSDFMEDFSELEDAISSRDWEKISSLIDVESFAKFYILQDFATNWDAFATSTFFYKDGLSDKIHAGPVWDLDNAFGWWVETMFFRRDLQYNGVDSTKVQSETFFELLKVKEFREVVSRIVNTELLPNSQRILNHISQISLEINSEILKDDEKWGIEGYYDEVLRLSKNVQRRLDYYSIYYANEEKLVDGNYLFKNLDIEFKISSVPEGGYKILRASDGKALTLNESYSEYGSVSFHSFKNSEWQRWYICRDNEGDYYLFSVATESVLAIDSSGNLITKPLSRAENEKFEIAEIGVFPLDTLLKQPD